MSFINFFSKNKNKPKKLPDGIKIVTSLSEVDKVSWNNIIGDDNPFIEYDFLNNLELSNSIGERSGWYPYYILYFENSTLVGAIFSYLKDNSYGEYIFDWAWASAYQKYGFNYYPKLVISVPFTPATGNRILVDKNSNYEIVSKKLIEAVNILGQDLNVSSIHWLFVTKEENDLLEKYNFTKRFTFQFHWKNNNYKNFDDFLNEFNSKKRNQLKRERKQANENLKIELLEGNNIKNEHWEIMYELYLSTISRKWATDYLTKDFFKLLHKDFSDKAVMVLASKNNEYVAGALNFRKGKNLYGRYWGAFEEFPSLHFEVCYYKAIEYCIEEKIQLFEAGAQGEHKLQRGFLPSYTYSNHSILDERFSIAIKDFIDKEKVQIDNTIKYYNEMAPYKLSKTH